MVIMIPGIPTASILTNNGQNGQKLPKIANKIARNSQKWQFLGPERSKLSKEKCHPQFATI